MSSARELLRTPGCNNPAMLLITGHWTFYDVTFCCKKNRSYFLSTKFSVSRFSRRVLHGLKARSEQVQGSFNSPPSGNQPFYNMYGSFV